MEGKTTSDVSSDQGADGHVQVHYFGNHENAWLTPDGDISMFDECFKERSSNPLAAFQDALKQALYCKEHLSSQRERDGVRNSSQEQPSGMLLHRTCINHCVVSSIRMQAIMRRLWS
ncbi:hypothetical protein MKX01_040712 [Papaver californicum]|nr:hypothetical protein MKX01_040712 [Papaver californicum]